MYGESLSMSKSIDIEFSNVVYEIQNGFRSPKKQILKGINGYFKSGEMTAIMGPSGAGKSTLLNILTGFIKDKNHLTGKINYINKKRNKITWNEYKRYSCYILQEDHLPNLYTVIEIMTISANLKMDNDIDQKTKRIIIDEILDTLDLIKNKYTRINELSGGEKKRLSVALELVENPSIIFLDEPMTGLDSYFCLQCVKMLKKLAKNDRTIICTIHQPSATIYETFDHIYLLADGRCMYEGAPKNTVEYFANLDLHCPKYHNPADYMIEIVTKEYGNFDDRLIEANESNKAVWRFKDKLSTIEYKDIRQIDYNEEEETIVVIKTLSEYKRFWILIKSSLIPLNRDWTLIYLKIFIHFLIGMFLGLFFLNVGVNCQETFTNIKYFVVISLFFSYTNMITAILKIPLELAILKKELFNNWYQLRTYYFSLLITDLPIKIFCSLVTCSISYLLSGQLLELNRFLMFFGISAMTTSIADTFGFLIGTLVNPVNGTFIGSVIMSILLLFDGGIILFNHMPKYLYYFSYLSYSRYTLEGFIQSIYGYNREKFPNSDDLTYCVFLNPNIIFKELGIEDGKYSHNLLILIERICIKVEYVFIVDVMSKVSRKNLIFKIEIIENREQHDLN
ncbi:hypothetical protein HZH68_013915 [Vespula germanica]|uniref:ABC transporter domain-containing protein n=1 Tax=Vespula germanica TaxID=30212 RepID=A0A834MUB8_VESGE|nr:hypothetical protein HZH68_013915 [Vespula germanica]